MKVAEVMTKAVVVLNPEDAISIASEKMTSMKVSGAPVVNGNGKLVGILSEADILRSMKTSEKSLYLVYPSLSSISVSFREKITEREAVEAYKEIEKIKVKDIMTKQVETAKPEDELRSAIKKMVSNGINRLPVVDQENKVIGIVTRGDILRGIAAESNNKNNES
ncbi:MAG: CBS domain-containing protein [Thermoplasmata archaeon]|nr:CBS domain-containing protein [Thermoplasmata archaeon]